MLVRALSGSGSGGSSIIYALVYSIYINNSYRAGFFTNIDNEYHFSSSYETYTDDNISMTYGVNYPFSVTLKKPATVINSMSNTSTHYNAGQSFTAPVDNGVSHPYMIVMD